MHPDTNLMIIIVCAALVLGAVMAILYRGQFIGSFGRLRIEGRAAPAQLDVKVVNNLKAKGSTFGNVIGRKLARLEFGSTSVMENADVHSSTFGDIIGEDIATTVDKSHISTTADERPQDRRRSVQKPK
jgi:hypothetical protein